MKRKAEAAEALMERLMEIFAGTNRRASMRPGHPYRPVGMNAESTHINEFTGEQENTKATILRMIREYGGMPPGKGAHPRDAIRRNRNNRETAFTKLAEDLMNSTDPRMKRFAEAILEGRQLRSEIPELQAITQNSPEFAQHILDEDVLIRHLFEMTGTLDSVMPDYLSMQSGFRPAGRG